MEDDSSSQPIQIKIQPVQIGTGTVPSTTAGGSMIVQPFLPTTVNSGSASQNLPTAPASGSGQPANFLFVPAADGTMPGTGISSGGNLVVKPNSELMPTISIDGTVDFAASADQTASTSQQGLVPILGQPVLPGAVLTDDQFRYIADMINPVETVSMEPIEIVGQELQVNMCNNCSKIQFDR